MFFQTDTKTHNKGKLRLESESQAETDGWEPQMARASIHHDKAAREPLGTRCCCDHNRHRDENRNADSNSDHNNRNKAET